MSLDKKAKIPIEHYQTNVPEEVVVSVVVVTYKHEKFIEQCLENILNQETTFEFEIIIGEDDSPDNTKNICIEYARKFPDKIRLLLHRRENVIKINGQPTGRFNFLYCLGQARGKYIAMCEGDDYWTDPLNYKNKLIVWKNNKAINLSVHNTVRVSETGETVFSKRNDGLIQFSDWCSSPNRLAHTASFVYKNNKILPDELSNLINGDFFISTYMADEMPIHYLSSCMAVYRMHETGVTNRPFTYAYYKQLEKIFDLLKKEVSNQYHENLNRGLLGRYFSYLEYQFNSTNSLSMWGKMLFNRRYSNYTFRDLLWKLRMRNR